MQMVKVPSARAEQFHRQDTMQALLTKPELQNQNRCAFDRCAGESSRSPRAGVDVHSVLPDVGMRHRRMAVDDEFAVVLRRVEKFMTNPEQIVEVLLLDRDSRANTRM